MKKTSRFISSLVIISILTTAMTIASCKNENQNESQDSLKINAALGDSLLVNISQMRERLQADSIDFDNIANAVGKSIVERDSLYKTGDMTDDAFNKFNTSLGEINEIIYTKSESIQHLWDSIMNPYLEKANNIGGETVTEEVIETTR